MQKPALLRHLKFRELNYLVTLKSTKSIHRAAVLHGISQPALSKILKELERVLGFQIFERSQRGIVPTSLGEVLISQAVQMISNLDALAERLDAEQHGHGRVYRIGATPNPALRLVPEAYIATRRKFPNLVVELVESSTDELLMALARGEYSLILGRSSSLDDRAGLKQTPLYPEIGVILGRAGHPARRRRQRNLDSLLFYPWIFPQHGPTRAAIELAFMRAGCNPPTPAFINYGTLLVCDILSRSDALAVLPFGAARQVLDSQAIAMIDVKVDFQLPAYAMYEPALAIADPVLASFQRALLEAASNLDESRREQKTQLSRLRR